MCVSMPVLWLRKKNKDMLIIEMTKGSFMLDMRYASRYKQSLPSTPCFLKAFGCGQMLQHHQTNCGGSVERYNWPIQTSETTKKRKCQKVAKLFKENCASWWETLDVNVTSAGHGDRQVPQEDGDTSRGIVQPPMKANEILGTCVIMFKLHTSVFIHKEIVNESLLDALVSCWFVCETERSWLLNTNVIIKTIKVLVGVWVQIPH